MARFEPTITCSIDDHYTILCAYVFWGQSSGANGNLAIVELATVLLRDQSLPRPMY
jgi:hypothetical protein